MVQQAKETTGVNVSEPWSWTYQVAHAKFANF